MRTDMGGWWHEKLSRLRGLDCGNWLMFQNIVVRWAILS